VTAAPLSILGIDGGLAALGWSCVIEDRKHRVLPIAHGLIETAKETKKRKLHVGSDDARRIEVILRELDRAVSRCPVKPNLIAYELPAAAKGARAGHTLGVAHGLIRTWGYLSEYPMVEVTVLDARRAATEIEHGRVTEEDTNAALVRRWPRLKKVSQHERDAVAVALAAFDSIEWAMRKT